MIMFFNMHTMRYKIFCVLLLFLCLQLIDKGNGQVFELTEQSFDQYTRDKDIMLVEFIMPWCHHCQALQPEWEKAAQVLAANREYVLGKVNCWESGKSLCDKLKIEMYPDIRLYRHGVFIESFEGDRNAGAILDFIQRAQSTPGRVGDSQPSAQLQSPPAPAPPPAPPPPLPQPPVDMPPQVEAKPEVPLYQSPIPPPPMLQYQQFPVPQTTQNTQSPPAPSIQYPRPQPLLPTAPKSPTAEQYFPPPVQQTYSPNGWGELPTQIVKEQTTDDTSPDTLTDKKTESWTDYINTSPYIPNAFISTDTQPFFDVTNNGYKEHPFQKYFTEDENKNLQRILTDRNNEVAGPSLASMMLPKNPPGTDSREKAIFQSQSTSFPSITDSSTPQPKQFTPYSQNNGQTQFFTETTPVTAGQQTEQNGQLPIQRDTYQLPQSGEQFTTQSYQPAADTLLTNALKGLPANQDIPIAQTIINFNNPADNQQAPQGQAQVQASSNLQTDSFNIPQMYTTPNIKGGTNTNSIIDSVNSVENNFYQNTGAGLQQNSDNSKQLTLPVSSGFQPSPALVKEVVKQTSTEGKDMQPQVQATTSSALQQPQPVTILEAPPQVAPPQAATAIPDDTDHPIEKLQSSALPESISNFVSPSRDASQYYTNTDYSASTDTYPQQSPTKVKENVSNVYPEPRDFGLRYLMEKKKSNLILEQNRLAFGKEKGVPRTRYPKPAPLTPVNGTKIDTTFPNQPMRLKVSFEPSEKGTYIMQVHGPYDQYGKRITVGSLVDSKHQNGQNNLIYKDLSPADRLTLLQQKHRELQMEEARQSFPQKYISPTNRDYKEPPSATSTAHLKRPLVRVGIPKNDKSPVVLTSHLPTNNELPSEPKVKTLTIKLPINVSLATVLKNIYEHMYEYYFHKRPLLDSNKEDIAAKKVIQGLISHDMKNISSVVKSEKLSHSVTSDSNAAFAPTFVSTSENEVMQSEAQKPNSISPYIRAKTIASPTSTYAQQNMLAYVNQMPRNPRLLKAWYYRKLYRDRMEALAARRGETREMTTNDNVLYTNPQAIQTYFTNPSSIEADTSAQVTSYTKQGYQPLTVQAPKKEFMPVAGDSVSKTVDRMRSSSDETPSTATSAPHSSSTIESFERQIYSRILEKQRQAAFKEQHRPYSLPQRISQYIKPGNANILSSNIADSMINQHASVNIKQPNLSSEENKDNFQTNQESIAQQNDVYSKLTSRTKVRNTWDKYVNTKQPTSLKKSRNGNFKSFSKSTEPVPRQLDVEDGITRSKVGRVVVKKSKYKDKNKNKNRTLSGPLESYLQTLAYLQKSNRLTEAGDMRDQLLKTPLSVIAEEHMKRIHPSHHRQSGITRHKIKGPSLYQIDDTKQNNGGDKLKQLKTTTNVSNFSMNITDLSSLGTQAISSPSNYFLIDTSGVADNKPMIIESFEDYMQKQAQSSKKLTSSSSTKNVLAAAQTIQNDRGDKRQEPAGTNTLGVSEPLAVNKSKTEPYIKSIRKNITIPKVYSSTTVFMPPLRHTSFTKSFVQNQNVQQTSKSDASATQIGQDASTNSFPFTRSQQFTSLINGPLHYSGEGAAPAETASVNSNVEENFQALSQSPWLPYGGVTSASSFSPLTYSTVGRSTTAVNSLPKSSLGKGSIYTYEEEIEEARRKTSNGNQGQQNETPINIYWDKKIIPVHNTMYDSDVVSKSFIPTGKKEKKNRYFSNDEILLQRHHHLRKRLKLMKKRTADEKDESENKKSSDSRVRIQKDIKNVMKKYENRSSVSQVRTSFHNTTKQMNSTGKGRSHVNNTAKTNLIVRNKANKTKIQKSRDTYFSGSNLVNNPTKTILSTPEQKKNKTADQGKQMNSNKSRKRKTAKTNNSRRKKPKDIANLDDAISKYTHIKVNPKEAAITVQPKNRDQMSKKSNILFDNFEFTKKKPVDKNLFNDNDMGKESVSNMEVTESLNKSMEKYKKSKILHAYSVTRKRITVTKPLK